MVRPVRIEDWSLVRASEFHPPEIAFLHGKVYGHPDHEDGKKVITSLVMEISMETGRAVTESGPHYELGTMHSDFAEWYNEYKKQTGD